MDIDVNDFMRQGTKGYNFQYIDIKYLDRVIRNVTRNSELQVYSSASDGGQLAAKQHVSVRMFTDEEINELIRSAEQDEPEDRNLIPQESSRKEVVEEQLTESLEPELSDDDESTICSSSSAESILNVPPSVNQAKETSDELIADIEDNLVDLDDEYCFEDFPLLPKESQEKGFGSVDSCYEFLESDSIIEELIIANDDNDGDSEGSIKTSPLIRVRSPVKPASAIIRTFELESAEPINAVEPILDFTAIERSSKAYVLNKRSPVVVNPPSSNLIRPASRKSLVEAFDTFVKVTELQKKACSLMDDIRHCLGITEEPEDELEERKREKRTAEFLIRFQRNYLYQINRLEEDVCVLPRSSPDLAQKVYKLYRIICHGLKLYLKNMKYFIINIIPEKLWTLIRLIISSTKVCVQKDIFDQDDLIIDEIFQKCQLLKSRLKQEAGKQKNSVKQRNPVRSAGSANTRQATAKLSMYGATIPVQKRHNPFQKRVGVKKPAIKRKEAPQQSQPKEGPRKQVRGKIIAIPMTKSSSSSLGHSKGSIRGRPTRTPTEKAIDDVVTQIQRQSDPLANSRLLKEVSGALTATGRDAAISEEVNQQLRQLIMDTIQNITHQQLKQMIPSLEHPNSTSTHKSNRTTTTGAAATAAGGDEPSEATEVTGATDQPKCVEKRFSTKPLALPTPTQVQPQQQQQQQQLCGRPKQGNDDETYHVSHGTVVGDAAAGGDDGTLSERTKRSPLDHVGDSCSSRSSDERGKLAGGSKKTRNGQKSVDLEISGGQLASGRPIPKAPSVAVSDSTKVAPSCSANRSDMQRRSLLEDRKRGAYAPPQIQKVNFSRNLQYLEIVSPAAAEAEPVPTATAGGSPSSGKTIPEVQSHLNLAAEVASRQRNQRRKEFYAQLKQQVCGDRLQAIRRMAQNPVYVNENFQHPWRTVSRISDQLVDELVTELTKEGFDFGEQSFVEEFLRLQLDG